MSVFSIQRMTKNEIQDALEWADQLGWNPGLFDADCFYAADPNGFFIGKLDDKPIAVGAAVKYGKDYGFCGLYIVAPEYRGHGYGIQLTKARLDYLGDCLTGLDGVMNMVNQYSHLGYVAAHLNHRYIMNTYLNCALNNKLINALDISFQELLAYDQRHFPALRVAFLKAWIHQPESFAFCYINNEKICGFGVIRKCREGYKIGPLFAENFEMADAIFQALVTKAEHPPFYMDIPEPNINSNFLVQKYNMQPLFATTRMYRNGKPDLPLQNIYGITTLELG